MRAINIINGAGGIRPAVEAGVLTSGVMVKCVRHGVEYLLAGSIRDDGPLADTVTDMNVAQERYASALADVGLVVVLAAEGIIRVYHRLGDYKHKQRNRLKLLVRSLGWDNFNAEFDQEFDRIRSEGGAELPFDPANPPVESAPEGQRPNAPSPEAVAAQAQASVVRGPGLVPQVFTRLTVDSTGLLAWTTTNVRPQKQQGFVIVTVATLLGDLTAEQMRLLASLASAFGDGAVRVTMDQNAVIRWVPSADVAALYQRLAAAGLARGGAGTLSDVVSCPGAESCRLAVTQSRGLGRLLADGLAERPALVAALPQLDIKISGCPNGCGQHHIAGIGFQGSLRKVGGRPAPHYFVLVGGGTTDGITTFGRVVATVPARRAFAALERLTDLYVETRAPGEAARTFFRRVDLKVAKAALADLERLLPEAAVENDFIDLGEDHAFTPEIKDGECSA